MSSSVSKKAKSRVQQPSSAAEITLFTKLRPYIFPALLIVVTIVAYSRIFSCGFIEAYDDEEFVTQNSVVLRGMTWYGLKWSLTSFMTGNWHPLTWWSHMLDVTIFGMNPAGHHATSLILHILNAVLLYGFLRKITGYCGRSFLVAALFAIHPLHVESVAWIAERKDLLSTLFGLISLHSYTQYVRTRRMSSYLAMFALLCLSLMSKPMLVTFPLLLLFLDYWPLERFREQSLAALVREKIPLLLPVLASSVVTLFAQKSVGAFMDRALSARIYSALDAYPAYLRKFFVPCDLAAFYPYVPVSALRALLSALFLAAVSLCVWRYRQRNPWLLTGWLWFLGLLLPVIGIISVGAQAYADRYTYLPAVGVCIMAVWSIAKFFEKPGFPPRIGAITAAAVIIICVFATWQQTAYWKDGYSLYGRELAVVKGNWHALFSLGNMLVEQKRYDEGIARYQEALRNHPLSEANIHHNLGVAYERKGDNTLATNYFRSTVQLAPRKDKGYLGLARIMSSRGDTAGALTVIREGLRTVPGNEMLLSKAAYLLHKMGDVTEAANSYRQAIATAPYFVQNYVNLGFLLMQQGKSAEFAALVGQLRRVDPVAADELAKLHN